MSQSALDYFGEIIIEQVRDRSIREWDKTLAGLMKGVKSDQYAKIYHNMSFEQQEYVKAMIPQIIDTTLHYMLWTLEQSKSIDIGITLDYEKTERLQDKSDGLSGELYTEDGWIMKFSKERYEELD